MRDVVADAGHGSAGISRTDRHFTKGGHDRSVCRRARKDSISLNAGLQPTFSPLPEEQCAHGVSQLCKYPGQLRDSKPLVWTKATLLGLPNYGPHNLELLANKLDPHRDWYIFG
jgi:hypothetical protein